MGCVLGVCCVCVGCVCVCVCVCVEREKRRPPRSDRQSKRTDRRRPPPHLVLHRRVALAARLELVEVVGDDLGERNVEHERRARVGEVLHLDKLAAPARREVHERPDVELGRDHLEAAVRLGDALALGRLGQVARAVDEPLGAVAAGAAVDDRRRRRDEVEVVLALEALLHDLHVQEPEEAAAEAEAHRVVDLGLELERGVVELQLAERLAQVLL